MGTNDCRRSLAYRDNRNLRLTRAREGSFRATMHAIALLPLDIYLAQLLAGMAALFTPFPLFCDLFCVLTFSHYLLGFDAARRCPAGGVGVGGGGSPLKRACCSHDKSCLYVSDKQGRKLFSLGVRRVQCSGGYLAVNRSNLECESS